MSIYCVKKERNPDTNPGYIPCPDTDKCHLCGQQVPHESKRTVTFGMYWTVYGRQTIDLPDDIDPNDEDAVKDYIRSVWDNVPLPEGDYLEGSDRFDDDSDAHITIRKDGEIETEFWC